MATVHIGQLSVEIFIPAANSLKAKRWVLKSLKDRLRSKYNISVAELDGEDKWQRALFGVCMVGSDKGYINGVLENVL